MVIIELLQQIEDLVLTYTEIDKDLYNEKKRDDWWMDVNEALKYKICDERLEELI